MLARWTALLILSFGLVFPPGGANATGGSKGTETGQTSTSTTSDKSSHGTTTAQTGGSQGGAKAAPSPNTAQAGQGKQ